MGTFKSLVIAYLLGGVTFIPLVLLAIILHAHYTFPYRQDALQQQSAAPADEKDPIVEPNDDTTALEAAKKAAKDDSASKARANRELEVAAGYFAVCREYTPMGINAKPIERSTPAGSATVAPSSPSVYQTMYRSIFDRKAAGAPSDNNGASQRPRRAGNMFYVVLRHGHLMLFDDEEQLEVRHVISLAHHDISIYSGGDTTPEGELFIKRNALCLSRKGSGGDVAPDVQLSKPFYLFSENTSAKEDFYFALLKNQQQTFDEDKTGPVPKQFDVKHIIALVQKLHASEDHIHSRWANALLGRIFLSLYKTSDIEDFVRQKITKKISRVKKPSFLTDITIQRIDTGEGAPYFTNMKLKDLTVEGECVVEADVRYNGNFRIEVSATAKIDLGSRFKVREVNLVLAVLVKRVEGHLLIKVKPPPSNRIWVSFQTMPKIEMTVEPIVSSRQITYTVILRQIENRIKEVLAETAVQPFWDDLPFFKTDHKKWRGGIFEGDDALPTSERRDPTPGVDTVDETKVHSQPSAEPHNIEKSHSLPVIEPQPTPTGFFGRKKGKTGTMSAASASSTSVDTKGASKSMPQSPVVASVTPDLPASAEAPELGVMHDDPPLTESSFTETVSGDGVSLSSTVPTAASQTDEPSLSESPNKSSSSSLKEREADEPAATAMAKAPTAPVSVVPPGSPARRGTESSIESETQSNDGKSHARSPSASSSFSNQTGSIGRSMFGRRDSATAAESTSTTPTKGDGTTQKRNALAAVTNAAAQAGQWSWKAIQRPKNGNKNGENGSHVDLSQPMGRGQPLPPVGVPLPGPTNGRTKLGPVPIPKRKPVPAPPLPDRPPQTKEEEHQESQPPPLPNRRRRGASQEQSNDNTEQNMLVIAAPDDSQPNTPVAEERPDVMAAWAGESVEEPEQAEDIHEESTTAPTEVHNPVTEELGDSSSSSHDGKEAKTDTADVSHHAPSTANVDEDDYSGWLDETAGDEEGDEDGEEEEESEDEEELRERTMQSQLMS